MKRPFAGLPQGKKKNADQFWRPKPILKLSKKLANVSRPLNSKKSVTYAPVLRGLYRRLHVLFAPDNHAIEVEEKRTCNIWQQWLL